MSTSRNQAKENLQDPSLLPQPEIKNQQTGRCAADDSRIEEFLKHAKEAKNLLVQLCETRGIPGGLHRAEFEKATGSKSVRSMAAH